MANLNESLEIGDKTKVSIDSISYVPSNAGPGETNTNITVEIVQLRNPVEFEVICDYGRNNQDKYWYCHSAEKKFAIRLTTDDSSSVHLDFSNGFESLDDAREGIARQIGFMYQIMKSSSLEQEKSGTNFQFVREKLDQIEFLNKTSNEEKNVMAREQCANNHRRVLIYTWYRENCKGFE
ncbi:hypothetical protein N9329_04590 [Gammaproteobacteria bacterium]|jgi:hypothetical protein|nr:hypothetical protein [Gammaproteobacteria bacterium]